MTGEAWLMLSSAAVVASVAAGAIGLWKHHRRENEIADENARRGEAQKLRDEAHERHAAERETAAAKRHAEMLASLTEGTRQMEVHAKAAALFAGRVAKDHASLIDHEGTPIFVRHTRRIENLEARLDEHLKDHD